MKTPTLRTALVVSAVIVAVAGVLLAMGQVPICKCGYVKAWHGEFDRLTQSTRCDDRFD